MPKCAVWSCKNSSNNIRIRDGVSFFHYPRDPLLASQWWSILAPVVTDSFKPATAVVCSDHFHNDHKYMCKTRHRLTRNAVPDLLLLGPASTVPRRSAAMFLQNDELESSDDETNMIVDIPEILRPPSESTVCRVCLMTEGRMKRVTEDNYEDAYKQVTGIKWNKEDKLPQHLCWECGHRLQSAARFKSKALAAHNLLKDIRSDQNFLTLNDIKLIDRNYHQLMSNLTQKHFPPNQYLSNTTINNNQIFSQQDTELLKHLKNESDKYHKQAQKSKVRHADQNIPTEIYKAELNYENLENKTDISNVMNAYKNSETNTDNLTFSDAYKNLSPNADESNFPTYNSLGNNSDNINFTETYKNLNFNGNDSIVPTYKNLETNTSNLNFADSYADLSSKGNDSNMPTCKNFNTNGSDLNILTYKDLETNTDSVNITDTYKNFNSNVSDSNAPTYGNLETNADNLNLTNGYKNLTPNADDSYLATYKNITSNTDNLNITDTYKNLNPGADDSYLPTYKNLDTNDDADLNITENSQKCTELFPKKTTTDLDTHTDVPGFTKTVKDETDKYDSDESDCLVIDAGHEANLLDNVSLETVIKSEYVGARDGAMSIDELIDIYNNDGDGDERLKELNKRFGDEATVQIDQGWGSQRRADATARRERNTKEMPCTDSGRPTAGNKPRAAFQTGNSIRSRAYDKLNQTLFTLTPVSEEEQIADIFKRQESFRFKRAPFKCYLCFRSFQVRRAYDTHMLRHDACNGAFECSVCKARQKSPRAVKTHMYGQHTVKISCNDCSFVTMNRSVARSHEKWHAGTIYQCPHCPSQFDQESTYKSHLRTRHVHAFACALCGFTFVSRKGLAVHRCKRHAHADQIPLLGPCCDTCELRFVSEEAYSRHLKLSSRHRTDNSPSYIGLRVAGN